MRDDNISIAICVIGVIVTASILLGILYSQIKEIRNLKHELVECGCGEFIIVDESRVEFKLLKKEE